MGSVKKVLKLVSFLGIALILVVAAALLAFYHLIQVGEFRRFLLSELEKRTRLKASVGQADVRLGKVTGISFRDFALLEPETGRPVITSERVLVRVALMPLFERRLDFYEIRFQRPTFKLTRDEKGEIRLLNLLLPPLTPGQQEGPFTLDLRQIKIEKGDLVFSEESEGGAPIPTHLREIDLTLRPPPAKNSLSPDLGRSVRGVAAGGLGPALEFTLKATVERDGRQARLASQGKMVLPQGEATLRQTWLDAETEIEGLPAGLVWDYYGHRLPLRAMRGTVGSRLRWRGSLAQQVHVKGAIQFGQLGFDAPQIFTGEVVPGNVRVELEMEWTPQEIRLLRLDWHSEDISLALRGSVSRLQEDDPELNLQLSTPFLPVVKARRYFPLRVLESPTLDRLVGAAQRGEISLARAGVAGRLSEIRRFSDPSLIWVEAELRDVGGQLQGEGQLPWRGINGRVVFEKGVIFYKGLRGAFGNSRVTELNGVYRGLASGSANWEARARGELDLGEMRAQLKSRLTPPPLAQIGAQIKELSGRGTFEIFLRQNAASPTYAEGRLALDNALLRVGELSLAQIKGGLTFSPKEIRLEKLSGLLAGSPLRASGSLSHYMTERPSFDLVFESSGIKAGVLSRILLSSGSPEEPGTVRGTVRYQGSFSSPEERRVSGTLELAGVELPFLSQRARDVSGRLRFDGADIDFQGLRGRLAESVFEFRGQWRHAERPQLIFTLNSPEMDVAALFPQGDESSSDWYDRLQAKGRVSIKKGKFEHFEFSELQTDLALDKRTWRLNSFSARSLGGTVQGSGFFTDRPDKLSFAVESKVQGVPVRGFLSWFDMATNDVTGNIRISGQLDSAGKTGAERKRSLNGAFHLEIEDGVLRRLRVLVRILSLIDISRWFSLEMPDINQEGIRFRRISGDFKVSRGVYSTPNLLVDSDDLRLTGAGTVDGAEGSVDFVVAVRPFPRISSAVSYIPLIGRGLAAIKDSFLVASFRVSGSLDNPIVIPAPLSTLSEFFFGALEIPKSLIGLSGDEKK